MSGSLQKIPGNREVTCIMFRTEDPQILGATLQNFIIRATWRPRFSESSLSSSSYGLQGFSPRDLFWSRRSWLCSPHGWYFLIKCGSLFVCLSDGDKIEKNEMGWSCGAYGWGEGVYRVLVGNRRERDHWGDLGVDGWIILGWISRRWHVAQNRDRCRTLVSAVMNLRVPLNAGNFLTSCKPVSFSRRTLHHGVSK